MEKKITPTKSVISYGVLFGILMILEFVLSYILNVDPSTNKSYGIIINILNFLAFPILFITYGANNFKNKINSGFISFGETLKAGVTICVIAALLSAIFTTVFNIIFPEFMESVLIKTREALEQKNNLTQEQIDMAIVWTKKFMNPAIAIPFTVVMYAFIGLIYSLIIGAIIKKEPIQNF